MHLRCHKDKWWTEPSLTKAVTRPPKHLALLDPRHAVDAWKPKHQPRVGHFAHSRKWIRYNRLQYIDAGYITPLYSLNDIGTRYGLTDGGKRYYRKYLLPEPFDIVRRRAVSAHHWSRFTLMALDTVLLDLQSRGFTRFVKQFDEHVALLHAGNEWLTAHYVAIYEEKLMDTTDKFGVQWLD